MIVSRRVSRFMSLALTGRLSICDKLYISTGSLSSISSVCGHGRQNNPSEFAIAFELLYSIS